MMMQAGVAQQRPPDVELDLSGAIQSLIRGWRTVLSCVVVGALLAAVLALVLKKTYTAEGVFLPPATTPTTSSPAALFSLSDPSDVFLGMLQSRSVADDVIQHTGLMDVYHSGLMTDARVTLQKHSKFSVAKNTLISVTVTESDPRLAARVANAYLDALYRLNGQMIASGSAHREQFFNDQTDRERKALDDAEQGLKITEEQTGVVLPEGEAQAGLAATARLQGNIDAAEAQLAALRQRATDQNPEVVQLRAQIGQLRAELRRQNSPGTSRGGGSGGGIVTARNLPGVTLEYANRLREVKRREQVYDALMQQYDKARIASVDPGPQFQVVDYAIVPERKSGPPRTLIVLGGALLGLLLGVLHLIAWPPLANWTRRQSTRTTAVHG